MSVMPMSAEADQELRSTISANLKTLLSTRKITQKYLAEQTGVSPATMNDYCSGKRVPQATFLVELRKLYGIDINDFLTSQIRPPAAPRQAADDSVNQALLESYSKYSGLYYTYFMDTSKFKGRDTLTPAMSLLSGVLYIYQDPASIAGIQYKCAAILGIRDQKEADELMESFRLAPSSVEILNEIESSYANKAYYGTFELSQEHAFLNLRHTGTDRALAILHRVDSNKDIYAGGIGTINSISKGRERMPVIQFFGICRRPPCMSPEEIQHSLLLKFPAIDVSEETDEILRAVRTLFIDNDEARSSFTYDHKRIFLLSILERAVRRNIERNAFRYGKISEEDDDIWYHIIKKAMEE